MTEVSIVVLLLGLIVQTFHIIKIESRLKDLESLVGSHWSAVQHECNAIWSNINPEEEDGEDGTADV